MFSIEDFTNVENQVEDGKCCVVFDARQRILEILKKLNSDGFEWFLTSELEGRINSKGYSTYLTYEVDVAVVLSILSGYAFKDLFLHAPNISWITVANGFYYVDNILRDLFFWEKESLSTDRNQYYVWNAWIMPTPAIIKYAQRWDILQNSVELTFYFDALKFVKWWLTDEGFSTQAWVWRLDLNKRYVFLWYLTPDKRLENILNSREDLKIIFHKIMCYICELQEITWHDTTFHATEFLPSSQIEQYDQRNEVVQAIKKWLLTKNSQYVTSDVEGFSLLKQPYVLRLLDTFSSWKLSKTVDLFARKISVNILSLISVLDNHFTKDKSFYRQNKESFLSISKSFSNIEGNEEYFCGIVMYYFSQLANFFIQRSWVLKQLWHIENLWILSEWELTVESEWDVLSISSLLNSYPSQYIFTEDTSLLVSDDISSILEDVNDWKIQSDDVINKMKNFYNILFERFCLSQDQKNIHDVNVSLRESWFFPFSTHREFANSYFQLLQNTHTLETFDGVKFDRIFASIYELDRFFVLHQNKIVYSEYEFMPNDVLKETCECLDGILSLVDSLIEDYTDGPCDTNKVLYNRFIEITFMRAAETISKLVCLFHLQNTNDNEERSSNIEFNRSVSMLRNKIEDFFSSFSEFYEYLLGKDGSDFSVFGRLTENNSIDYVMFHFLEHILQSDEKCLLIKRLVKQLQAEYEQNIWMFSNKHHPYFTTAFEIFDLISLLEWVQRFYPNTIIDFVWQWTWPEKLKLVIDRIHDRCCKTLDLDIIKTKNENFKESFINYMNKLTLLLHESFGEETLRTKRNFLFKLHHSS